ncbi:TolC family protein, partial [Poseidonibacter sp.]|uniref:TolC family protein n=1 Tax=Poseidonibacter sp. TaxID=2321188 RepID=UPI003C791E81
PEIDLKLEEMEKIALENRPEVLESRYKERISQKETTSAILRMLPGININAGLSYNSSEYLLNNDWTSYGASVSWNLLDIFKGSTFRKIAKTKIELAREQKLAISMAVLSQVHLSLAEFNQAKKEYKLAKEYLDVAEGIFKLTKVNNRLNTGSKLVFIKEKLNYILSFLRHSSSYANVQNSYGKIFASIGKYEEFKKKSFTQLKTNVEFKDIKPLAVKEKEEPKLKKPIVKAKKETLLPKDKKTITAVAIENAYIRSKANPNSDIKSVLEKDENIEVISKFYNESGYWVETKDGYIQLKSLKMNALKKKNEGLYLVKTFRPGNIRKEANWQSQIKYTIPKNRTIYVSKIVKNSGGTWYKTSDGYISSLVIKAKRK